MIVIVYVHICFDCNKFDSKLFGRWSYYCSSLGSQWSCSFGCSQNCNSIDRTKTIKFLLINIKRLIVSISILFEFTDNIASTAAVSSVNCSVNAGVAAKAATPLTELKLLNSCS